MSGGAIAFMLCTMGGVLGLNVLCILLGLRLVGRDKAAAAAPPTDAPTPAEP
jgi:hypothetical protein